MVTAEVSKISILHVRIVPLSKKLDAIRQLTVVSRDS